MLRIWKENRSTGWIQMDLFNGVEQYIAGAVDPDPVQGGSRIGEAVGSICLIVAILEVCMMMVLLATH